MEQETINLIRDMRKMIEEAHDLHIFDIHDEHPEGCDYCKMIARADKMLKAMGVPS